VLKLYVGSAYYDKGERAWGWGEFLSRPRIRCQGKNWLKQLNEWSRRRHLAYR